MYDKYKEFIIFEIENGWILKVEKPVNPGELNNVSYESTFYPDKEKLLEALKKEL